MNIRNQRRQYLQTFSGLRFFPTSLVELISDYEFDAPFLVYENKRDIEFVIETLLSMLHSPSPNEIFMLFSYFKEDEYQELIKALKERSPLLYAYLIPVAQWDEIIQDAVDEFVKDAPHSDIPPVLIHVLTLKFLYHKSNDSGDMPAEFRQVDLKSAILLGADFRSSERDADTNKQIRDYVTSLTRFDNSYFSPVLDYFKKTQSEDMDEYLHVLYLMTTSSLPEKTVEHRKARVKNCCGHDFKNPEFRCLWKKLCKKIENSIVPQNEMPKPEELIEHHFSCDRR